MGIVTPPNGQGAEIRRAAKAAAEQLNAEGGMLGERVMAIDADDGCSGEEGNKAAQYLVERGVAVVIGHSCASAASAAVPTP